MEVEAAMLALDTLGGDLLAQDCWRGTADPHRTGRSFVAASAARAATVLGVLYRGRRDEMGKRRHRYLFAKGVYRGALEWNGSATMVILIPAVVDSHGWHGDTSLCHTAENAWARSRGSLFANQSDENEDKACE
ncbi:hypothetical protein MTO96_010495 [Rhipicephalus appendiculatus]